jgi:hypothetical protein
MIKPTFTAARLLVFLAAVTAGSSGRLPAQALGARSVTPNLAGQIGRPLRYRPDGMDFVIVNGGELFNRPLYGGNTAFRVDAGDRPEFTLYLPGRGGNLRLGLRSAAGATWLHEAASVIARYRPGEMLYEIGDPLLGSGGMVRIAVLALDQTAGLIVRAEAQAVATGVELVWAFGGVNGQRGRRDGDIGTELVPISEYFQLRPEFCRDNRFELAGRTFTLYSGAATIVGLTPAGAELAVADATQWSSCAGLLASAGKSAALRVVTGRVALANDTPLFLALQRVAGSNAVMAEELDTYRAVAAERPGMARRRATILLQPPYRPDELPAVFAEAEAHGAALRSQVVVDTPDAYLNAAVAALNVAVDAVWDESQGAVMHGAVAWRTALPGWRGPYAPDALGWHARARRHFSFWAARQNNDSVPARLPPPDENANLARSEAALHSNGDISNSHYDMNLVYIDALYRHLQWTGDLEFARQVWPVIERHLAWERRLFRREFGPDRLPLYEAYAAIWASDDLQYNGGGVTHASAYNYWHNLMAARLARLLGKDSVPYQHEAELIARAMREYLWLPDRGRFAEYKDLLGLQLVHPSAGLWTFYHTMDSGLPTPEEAWQMTMDVDQRIPHLPVYGSGVPTDDNYHVLSTTDWMPYSWSVNNVVLGENVHAALGYWQAGRAGEAYRLTKSALLASMFMGICPGDVGSMNYLDVYRREAQRDFADGGGVLARALIEGLFGVKPDLLAGELRVVPGFPATWRSASLRHPDVSFAWRRAGETETFTIESRFVKPLVLRLQLAARGDDAIVMVDGRPTVWKWLGGPVPQSYVEVRCPLSSKAEIVVAWKGVAPAAPGETMELRRATTAPFPGADWRTPMPGPAKFETTDLTPYFNDGVTNIFQHEYRSPRSPYCSLAIPKQGLGGWAGEVNAAAEIDDSGLRAAAGANGGRIILPNGVPFATPGPGDARNIVFTSRWRNFPPEAVVPLDGRARHVYLLLAGSTNWMQSRLDNGEVVVTYADGSAVRLALHNPTSWWPIDQDYFIDDYQFQRSGPVPPRVDLKTGRVRLRDEIEFKGQGRRIAGGAATVLDLPLDPEKELRSLTVRTLANEVVIGLMALTLAR